jgi:hypothetical protein
MTQSKVVCTVEICLPSSGWGNQHGTHRHAEVVGTDVLPFRLNRAMAKG